MKYFTHYWSNKTWEREKSRNLVGELLDHTAGNLFKKRGVEIGDAVYIVTVIKGKLFVSAKTIVRKICSETEAARILNDSNLWENATDHIIASESTPINWSNEISLAETRELEFISGSKIINLEFKTPTKLDQQTLRGVRQLEPQSAAMLDKTLDDLELIESTDEREKSLWIEPGAVENDEVEEFESGVEGNKKQRYTTYYERLPENRRQAIKIHGVTCKACNFNFEKTHGTHGKDFIHVHHIKPISQFEKPRKINPETDLTVLCPNCHSMVHRYKNKTLSVEELKKVIRMLSKK